MTWTSAETAIWIRGAVQSVQQALVERGQQVVRDGLFDARTWHAFMAAMAGQEQALTSQGPRGLAGSVLGTTEEEARAFAAAWAWWQMKREGRDPGTAQLTINDFNAALTAGGDQPLVASDAEAFLGDRPAATAAARGGRVALVVLGIVGLGFAAVIGWSAAKRGKCGALEDRRSSGRRGG
jgi:hypothetical protein